MNWIFQSWPWYVAGPIIASILVLMLLFGKTFGVSSNFRTMCSILGAGKFTDFFKFDWKAQIWNLVFIVGAVLGGFIAHNFLSANGQIELSSATVERLKNSGIATPGSSYNPPELFGKNAFTSFSGWVFLIVGGLFIGFGTRYGGGCTSGHAISGLSTLQLPSLIAVVGFFIGGLIMTHFLLPYFI